MGLGGGPSEWADFEWVDLADVADLPVEPLAAALATWLVEHPVWAEGEEQRVLLVDLDNLRADPRRWRVRMAAVLALARQADHAVLAGQVGAVQRARPHLAELAALAIAVPDGSDLADLRLLRAVDDIDAERLQIVVMSNDWIFAALAERGPLTVISPGRDAVSGRLRSAADLVVDLEALEEAVAEPGRR